MSEPSRQPVAGSLRAASLSVLLTVAASWAMAVQSASAVEPDRHMAELELRLFELERRLLASEEESAQTSDSADVIAALERRVRQLEGKLRARGGGVQIRAPLVVTDADGNVVLRVADASAGYAGAAVSIVRRKELGGTLVLTQGDNQIVTMGSSAEGNGKVVAVASDGGAHVTADGSQGLIVYASADSKVVRLSASPRGTGELTLRNADVDIAELGDFGLRLWDPATAGQMMAHIGSGPRGNTALRISNPKGTLVAAVGVEPDRGDSGALTLTNSQGLVTAAVMGGERGTVMVSTGSSIVAQMSVDDKENGAIQVSNAGVAVASLWKAASGGALQLASDQGVPMVEAGVRQDGLGTVLTGPTYKCTPALGVMNIAMPDCLVGRR